MGGFLEALKPDLYLPSLLDLDPAWLVRHGIKALISDLDNTMAAWKNGYPDSACVSFFDRVKQSGIACCILSNAPGWRVRKASEILDIPGVPNAGKPRRAAFQRALQVLGTSPQETCLVGDQIFTDIWGARRVGLTTVLVVPFGTREFVWTKLVRHLERAVLRGLTERGLLTAQPRRGGRPNPGGKS